jgi:hypothetical protein
MNLLHKTEELSRFEKELFLLYSIIRGGEVAKKKFVAEKNFQVKCEI